MNVEAILRHVDHTLLTPTATEQDILRVCDEGMQYHTASVCIPPAFVRAARRYVGERLPICTVIGFPNGYATTAAKCFETEDAVANGAAEIDMVIPLGAVKAGDTAAVAADIRAVRNACSGKILKVIVETCLLAEAEKRTLCAIVSDSGADYIKTSTGFAGGGATVEDIALFAAQAAPHLKIKAAGGIATLADAERFLSLGADRLGTSRIVKLVKEGSRS